MAAAIFFKYSIKEASSRFQTPEGIALLVLEAKQQVLAVDLDRTLIKADLLEEAIFIYLKKRPWGFLSLARSLLKSRVNLKKFLVRNVDIKVDLLPYNSKVIDCIKEARASGHAIVLASASPVIFVQAVADHLGLFDKVIATEDNNLKGVEKLAALRASYPKADIRYIGDSNSDIPIWKGLGKALMVNPSRITRKRVEFAQIPIEIIDDSQHLSLKLITRSFRYHQWAKNFLIFLPLFLAHAYQVDLWKITILSFISFSLTASSIYILNDLFDLEADRKHPKKKQRPFASGALSISQGVILYGITSSIAVLMALLINPGFLICLLIYFIANLAYTLRLKQVHSLDIIMLAGMYTIRIMAGGETTGIEVSQWLLGFSTFLFFGLAALKRFVEVSALTPGQRAAGRGYFAEDKVPLAALGGGSSLMACLVLALYFNSPTVGQLYQKPDVLWLILPIHMYWVSSIWILASRGQIDDDPVLHTIKSRTTYVLAAIVGLIVYLAI